MHIFIDESGTFTIPENGRFSPCVQGALVVPDYKLDQLFKKYSRIRHSLPKENGEVKGRLMKEPDVAKVIEILRRNLCIFEAVVVEMSLEVPGEVEEHRSRAANGLTKNLTSDHQPELIENVWKHRAYLEKMSLPLYVQYTMISELFARIVREVPVYWAQRRMNEVINYHWVVDGKGDSQNTKSEDWWSVMKLGLLQSKLAREPMIALEGLDYSKFDEKFRMPMPNYLKETILPFEEGFDLRLLFDESFRFSSKADFGLELADIVTNATRRALKGNLGELGWSTIPNLMINRREQYISMCSLSKSVNPDKLPYAKLITQSFNRGGRQMLI